MVTSLDQVCYANLPLSALSALAGVRCSPDITVALVGDRAWVRWEPGNAQVLLRLLPVAGVELYVLRKGLWYRHGRFLPSFDLPLDVATRPLCQVLTPAPVQPEPPRPIRLEPCLARLVREERPRETSGMLCRLAELRAWADMATSAQLGLVGAARAGEQVMLLGRRLPALATSERFWGERILAPLGWRLDPTLPESSLIEVFALADDELALVRAEGVEILSRRVFQPLTRAGVRLAQRERF